MIPAGGAWGTRFFFFFQAEDGIRDADVTGVQTCALPIWPPVDRRTLAAAPDRLVQRRHPMRRCARGAAALLRAMPATDLPLARSGDAEFPSEDHHGIRVDRRGRPHSRKKTIQVAGTFDAGRVGAARGRNTVP